MFHPWKWCSLAHPRYLSCCTLERSDCISWPALSCHAASVRLSRGCCYSVPWCPQSIAHGRKSSHAVHPDCRSTHGLSQSSFNNGRSDCDHVAPAKRGVLPGTAAQPKLTSSSIESRVVRSDIRRVQYLARNKNLMRHIQMGWRR